MRYNRPLVAILEVLIGPLPATIFLAPTLFSGLLGSMLMLLILPFESSTSWRARFDIAEHMGLTLLVFLSGLLGLAALWIVVLVSKHTLNSARLVRPLLASWLLAGIWAGAFTFVLMGSRLVDLSRTQYFTRALLMAGPMLVALRHLFQLFRAERLADA